MLKPRLSWPRAKGEYGLRWFTPGAEVPLCGHATLAAAHVLWTETDETADRLTFSTLSGPLFVEQTEDGYRLDFPADPPVPIDVPEGLSDALGVVPEEMLAGQYLMAVLKDADAVRTLSPDLMALASVRSHRGHGVAEDCLCVTAPGEGDIDFVSRFFGPTVSITEDPVTGSAHCMMTPYWADRFGKTKLSGFQASARGGHVGCELAGDRVLLSGQAVTYMRGDITI
ncbi:PhzF family phenazine biosynthesis protein [Parvularcula sp. LCG005]|nr:PhzF family phenazine biosynthesis protein [Parvularcula sp. LCG005]WOI52355.1 PhzF family phenazine biosynthesis protein [Parvularcula sp. LCG005]